MEPQSNLFRTGSQSVPSGDNIVRFKDVVRLFTQSPTSGPRSALVIRLMVGGVFLSEGLLKFAYVNQGVGRFTRLGMPMPGVLAAAIALLEIGGGLLLMSVTDAELGEPGGLHPFAASH
jgi:hypothetical protein